MDRAFTLAFRGSGRAIRHADDVGRIVDFYGQISGVVFVQTHLDTICGTRENYRTETITARSNSTLHNGGGRSVTPHGVNDDGQLIRLVGMGGHRWKSAGREALSYRPRQPQGRGGPCTNHM